MFPKDIIDVFIARYNLAFFSFHWSILNPEIVKLPAAHVAFELSANSNSVTFAQKTHIIQYLTASKQLSWTGES